MFREQEIIPDKYNQNMLRYMKLSNKYSFIAALMSKLIHSTTGSLSVASR